MLPEWLLEKLRLTHPRDDDQAIIACIELVGAISLLLTYPENFAHRKAFLFQDNSCAFAAMVSGRSSSDSLNTVANVYHLMAAALGSRNFSSSHSGSMVAEYWPGTPARKSNGSNTTRPLPYVSPCASE